MHSLVPSIDLQAKIRCNHHDTRMDIPSQLQQNPLANQNDSTKQINNKSHHLFPEMACIPKCVAPGYAILPINDLSKLKARRYMRNAVSNARTWMSITSP